MAGEIWLDILNLHYGNITESELQEKYGQFYAITRLTVSTSNLLNRFKKLNKGKEWRERIKPFNFFLVGFRFSEKEGKPIKPLAPFTKDYQSIVFRPFIDYESGESREGLQYWKPLSQTISDYIDHPEYKFEGDIGQLARKHVFADGVTCIGKEANSIDEQALEVKQAQTFMEKAEIYQKILDVSQGEAEKIGVRRGTLSKIKKKIREKRSLNLETKAVKKLIFECDIC